MDPDQMATTRQLGQTLHRMKSLTVRYKPTGKWHLPKTSTTQLDLSYSRQVLSSSCDIHQQITVNYNLCSSNPIQFPLSKIYLIFVNFLSSLIFNAKIYFILYILQLKNSSNALLIDTHSLKKTLIQLLRLRQLFIMEIHPKSLQRRGLKKDQVYWSKRRKVVKVCPKIGRS